MNALRLIAAVLALVSLGSCSRVFEVKAAFVDGAIVFRSADDSTTHEPWCWNNFAVVDEDGRPVWEFEVPYGAFKGNDRCGPNFPIGYGEPPEKAETLIPPQRLKLGRTYVIVGDSAGLLEGAFRIDRIERKFRLKNLDPGSAEAVRVRDAFFAWQDARDPPRISQTPTSSPAFEVQEPPSAIPEDHDAGAAGRDPFTWVLHPDAWWNLPSLSYRTLGGDRTKFNLWCRYTGGPIYARVPPPATEGAVLRLASGPHRVAVRLVGAGNPGRRTRIDAVLDGQAPLFRHFAETGDLTIETSGGSTDVDAISGSERAVVTRFFDACAESRPLPPIVQEVSDR